MREVHAGASAVADLDIEALMRRLVRERKARQAAEAALEEKARELFEANKEVRQLFTGSLGLLTDVLAMARPELFQKAAKIQRWAGRIAPHLGIAHTWELKFAAMLYPLGMLSLPDEVAEKKMSGMLLSADEQRMVLESTRAAHTRLMQIPRLEAVGRAILYCNKGYDGSGYPIDDVKGEAIPHAARVLKVLIDLADESTGVDRTRDFHKMAKNSHLYDKQILKVAYEHLRRAVGQPEVEGDVLTLPPGALQPGDVVHRDIVDQDNRLMLAAGAVCSEIVIQRLRTLKQKGRVDDEIQVVRK